MAGMPEQLRRGLLEKRRQPRRMRRDKRPVFEELVAIDARAMARKRLIPHDYSTWRYDFIVPQARLTVSASRGRDIQPRRQTANRPYPLADMRRHHAPSRNPPPCLSANASANASVYMTREAHSAAIAALVA